jgi:2-amino-4-hydroxy-6-hydroxymethyldihydropteridine diphosphokinase
MNELHKVYLNLGSNIQPEMNLVQAIKLLSTYGEVRRLSRAWESKSVGAAGPNFLNACALFMSFQTQIELKERVIHPIEAELGRVRSENKFIPRTIDIDIILFDNQPHSDKFWEEAFVIVPLAEIYPEYKNPKTGEPVSKTAAHLRQEVWIEVRPEVLSQISGGYSKV